jgi:hypothetical protein
VLKALQKICPLNSTISCTFYFTVDPEPTLLLEPDVLPLGEPVEVEPLPAASLEEPLPDLLFNVRLSESRRVSPDCEVPRLRSEPAALLTLLPPSDWPAPAGDPVLLLLVAPLVLEAPVLVEDPLFPKLLPAATAVPIDNAIDRAVKCDIHNFMILSKLKVPFSKCN